MDKLIINLIVGFLVWLPLIYLFMALAEYIAHRWFMHKKTVLTSYEYKTHTVEHHGRKVNSPMYPYVDLSIRYHLLYGSPGIAAFLVGHFVFDRQYALGGLACLLSMFVFHSQVYSKIHRATHELERNWAEHLPYYERMKQHHLLHHRYPSKNFAVIFLWTDSLFGTKVRS